MADNVDEQRHEMTHCQNYLLSHNFNEILAKLSLSKEKVGDENICDLFRKLATMRWNISTNDTGNTTLPCVSRGWLSAEYNECASTYAFHEFELPLPWIHLRLMYCIYWIGYSISLLFLLLAIAAVAKHRKLWCLRNIIHCNLIACFALHNLTWISYSLIAHEIMTKYYGFEEIAYCNIPTTILKYFITAGFFWMFIEGLYLLMSVACSFQAKRIQFWMCAIVGWIVPLGLIAATTIAQVNDDPIEECWNEQYHLDYIFIGPVLGILLLNVIFLVIIMYVVVTKLQVTVPAEATRYWKAIKALFILCPLLGVNYIFVLIQPAHLLWARLAFSYYFAIMTSLQGSLVAILFCFRNNEVWQTVKRSMRKWTSSKGIARDGSRRMQQSMRIDTLTSMMIDFEPSSGACHWRRHQTYDTKVPSSIRGNGRNSKRSTNVIIMRDDGELRRFLPQSNCATVHRKITAPVAMIHQKSVEQSITCSQPLSLERRSLPMVSDRSPSTPRPESSSVRDTDPQQGRRSGSNYRPVNGRSRVRYLYSGDQTSVF